MKTTWNILIDFIIKQSELEFYIFAEEDKSWSNFNIQIMPKAFILGWIYALSSLYGFIEDRQARNIFLYTRKGIKPA